MSSVCKAEPKASPKAAAPAKPGKDEDSDMEELGEEGEEEEEKAVDQVVKPAAQSSPKAPHWRDPQQIDPGDWSPRKDANQRHHHEAKQHVPSGRRQWCCGMAA